MSNIQRNSFLRSLASESRALLERHLTPVEMPLGQVLYRPDDSVDTVYFPETCVLSVLTVDRDGETVETSMVGVEGALGLLEACGSGRTQATCLVQVDGRALKAPAAPFRAAVLGDPEVARRAWSLVEVQLNESRQSGLCQALHSVERRLARWLLESTERSGGRNPMPLTQEFIASMLGVQRTTVTGVAAELQKAGLIGYRRGLVELRDIAGLEHRACDCRAVVRSDRARLGFAPADEALAAA